jgi:putative NADH-flavin reductase
VKITIIAATGGTGRHALQQAVAAGHKVTAVARRPGQVARLIPAAGPGLAAELTPAAEPVAGLTPAAEPVAGQTGPGLASEAGPAGESVAGQTRMAGQTRAAGQTRVVGVDLAAPDQAALESAVADAGAVLSALGPRSATDAGIVSRGTQAIVAAMRAAGTRRLIVVSAAPIGTVASPARPHPPKHDPGDGFFMRHLLSPGIKTLLRGPYADLALMEDIVAASGLDWTVVRPPRLTDKPLTGSYRTAYGRNLRRGLTISRADVAHLMLDLAGDPESIGETVGIAY